MEGKARYNAISSIDENTAMIRLTALWALSEAGLGGMLHFFRTPFTGLLIGSVAVVLIGMMAYVSEKPYKSIPKALLLVLIVKMTISPHSPLPAYLAVSFQGLLAAVLFSTLPSFRLSCFLLGFLALMESALQKIITLTLIFGKSLWESIDLFVDYVFQKLAWIQDVDTVNGSYWLIVYYISIYAVFGLIVGYLASVIPGQVNAVLPNLDIDDLKLSTTVESNPVRKRKAWWKSNKFRILIIILLLMVTVYVLVPEASMVLRPAWIFLRVFIVLGLWFFIIGPFLLKIFQSYLDKKATDYQSDVRSALALIPVFKQMVFSVWDNVSEQRGFVRLKSFVIRLIAYTLLYK